MELIGALDRGRLQRELRQREVALREAARALEAAEPPQLESVVAPKPESLVARYASTPRNWWECDFCGRGFHGYGQFLNHNCHGGD